jgi:hypothetical protein
MSVFKESDFSRGWGTLELKTNAVFLIVLLIFLYLTKSIIYCQIAFTIAACSYIISRALFKKNRGSLFTRALKTSEFKVYVIAQILLMLSCYSLDPKYFACAIVCMALVQSAFNFCRGYTKSYTVSPQILNMGL